MKTSWEEKTLESISEIFADGDWIESKDQSDSGIRLIQTGNIGFGFFKDKEDKSRFISVETFNRLKCTEIFPGDILVSRLPDPVGKSCIIPPINGLMITGVDCTIIRLKGFVKSEYVRYYQMSPKYLNDVQMNVSGATRQRISRKKLGIILVPIPPLPEQQRIVEILDEAFAAIDKAKANAEKNLRNAKELFESYLQGVFENKGNGWEEKSIGDVCDFENGDRGKNYPNKSHRVEFGIPFINAGHLNDNEIDYKEMDYISEQRFNMLGNGKIKPNDLLFCLRGSLGKVANVGKLDKGAIASSLVILRVKKQLNNDYFLYFLNSKLTINQILDFGNGAAQPNLSAGSLKKFKIPIPPSISIQEKIVQQLKSLSTETKRLESIYHQKISDLEELKKSILQKAFNGELNTADICA